MQSSNRVQEVNLNFIFSLKCWVVQGKNSTKVLEYICFLKNHRRPFKVRILESVLRCIKSQEQHDLQRFHKPVSYNQWLW